MAKPGPQCSVCKHRELPAIDLALARGVSTGALAHRYGLGSDSVYRHRRNHLPPQLRAKLLAGPDLDIDIDKLRETESQSLLANLVALRRRLFHSFDVAEESGDSHMVSRIAAQLHRNMELVGKLLGDLAAGHTNVTNVLIQPQYVELRVGLVSALRPFPEAAHAVASVLRQIEGKAAAEMAADKRQLAGALQ